MKDYLQFIITDILYHKISELTAYIDGIKWENERDIVIVVDSLIEQNLAILSELNYRPLWMDLSDDCFDYLSLDNFRNFLLFSAYTAYTRAK